MSIVKMGDPKTHVGCREGASEKGDTDDGGWKITERASQVLEKEHTRGSLSLGTEDTVSEVTRQCGVRGGSQWRWGRTQEHRWVATLYWVLKE